MSHKEHKRSAPKVLKYAIVTLSDSRDLSMDRGGDYLVERLEEAGQEVSSRVIHKDEPVEIEAAVRAAVAREDVDLVLTTGGTGISPRDQTYDTLRKIFDSDIPGFGELFRTLSYQEIGSAAILSRATAGVLAGKVVLALPGSPKALRLAMDEIILKEAGHLVSHTRR